MEASVEGVDRFEVLKAARVVFGADVDPVGQAAHVDDVNERGIRRGRDLERSAAGAGHGGRPPERPHHSLPFRGRPPLGASRGALLEGLRWREVHNGSGKRDTAQSV